MSTRYLGDPPSNGSNSVSVDQNLVGQEVMPMSAFEHAHYSSSGGGVTRIVHTASPVTQSGSGASVTMPTHRHSHLSPANSKVFISEQALPVESMANSHVEGMSHHSPSTVTHHQPDSVTLDPGSIAQQSSSAQMQVTSTNVTRVRRYKVFPGRNRFFCNGRIIMAKQISVFYFTVTLLVTTCVLFFIFDCPFLAMNISPLIPVVAVLLFLFVLFTLFRTSFTDPGIIPRATPEEAADVERQIIPKQSNSPTYRPPPRTKEVIINNQPIKLKYCFTCKIFRPPRASHCSLCDNCVERFDHHCPWVGNCVGKRNYRFFYMFIVSLALLCVYVFACLITHIILLSKNSTFFDAVKISPVSMIEMVICFFSVWSILGLAGFHTYLIMSNLTTNEDIKGSFSSKRNNSVKNPYTKGSAFKNCSSILCSPLSPSPTSGARGPRLSFPSGYPVQPSYPAYQQYSHFQSYGPNLSQRYAPGQSESHKPSSTGYGQRYSSNLYGHYSQMQAESGIYLGHDHAKLKQAQQHSQHGGSCDIEHIAFQGDNSVSYSQHHQQHRASEYEVRQGTPCHHHGHQTSAKRQDHSPYASAGSSDLSSPYLDSVKKSSVASHEYYTWSSGKTGSGNSGQCMHHCQSGPSGGSGRHYHHSASHLAQSPSNSSGYNTASQLSKSSQNRSSRSSSSSQLPSGTCRHQQHQEFDFVDQLLKPQLDMYADYWAKRDKEEREAKMKKQQESGVESAEESVKRWFLSIMGELHQRGWVVNTLETIPEDQLAMPTLSVDYRKFLYQWYTWHHDLSKNKCFKPAKHLPHYPYCPVPWPHHCPLDPHSTLPPMPPTVHYDNDQLEYVVEEDDFIFIRGPDEEKANNEEENETLQETDENTKLLAVEN